MDNKPSQAAFLSYYTQHNRKDFNEELFTRDEDGIIEELKKVILSCQRDKHFIIKVLGFEVVEDYNQINQILRRYEDEVVNKNKRKLNQYDYINLKDSDIKLLIIKYYLKELETIKQQEEYIDIICAIPRIVNKYYFRISGNYYSAMYQMIDSSTYNNMTSNNRRGAGIILKRGSMPPISIYQYIVKLKDVYSKKSINCNIYQSIMFKKKFPAILYLFAKFGYYNCLNFLGVGNIIKITPDPIAKNKNMYCFKADELYVSIPKFIFEADHMVQSIVASIIHYVSNANSFEKIFSQTFWIESLGREFAKSHLEQKGSSLLDSLESLYDIITEEGLALPPEEKESVYHIMRWMMREFPELKQKDNLDLRYKKIRIDQYLALLYSMKFCNSVYRISGGNGVKINKLLQVVKIPPLYLLRNITKCKLVNYRDLVNDFDAIIALQYTTKRLSNMNNARNVKTKDTVPEVYKFVHPSHLGRVDPDSSHKSDPGTSGILCPYVKLYGDMNFSDYQEPNFWQEKFNETMNEYKKIMGIESLLQLKSKVLNIDTKKEQQELKESSKELKQLAPLLYKVEEDKLNQPSMSIPVPLSPDGLITYQQEVN